MEPSEQTGDAQLSGYGLRVRRAYLVALGLIALMSVLSYSVLNGFIARQGTTATIVHVAGQQGALAQRIARLANQITLTVDPGLAGIHRTVLRHAVEEMAKAHVDLTIGNVARGLPGIASPEEAAFYKDEPHALDRRVAHFVATARDYLAADRHSERRELAEKIAASAETDLLLRGLDAVVQFHEDRARAEAVLAERLHLAVMLATLGALLAEARLIFRPLVRELGAAARALEASRSHLAWSAFHDHLTGLGNRAALRAHVDAWMAQTGSGDGPVPFAVIALDLDNFKAVNSAGGHAGGDRLLEAVAGVISGAIRTEDRAFRLGGDEFLIFVPTAEAGVPEALAERVRAGIATAAASEAGMPPISASFGIARAPHHGRVFDAVLKSADIALYAAKSRGKDRFAIFEESLRASYDERQEAERFLRAALAAGRFEPFFQPQIDMSSGAVVGVEALLRARGPDGEIVAPGRFLAVAEETGLIVPIGRMVIRAAMEAARGWIDAGLEFGRLAVNASSVQLRDEGFADFIAATLAEKGLPAGRLTLEIVETVLLESDDDAIVGVIERIRGLGVSIELDDFGTGYTSIANVSRLKVDRLKIDRSFVRDLDEGSSAPVLRAILSMAEGLNVGVIAEGIETAAQARRLVALGCSAGQGFRFARPMPAGDIAAWLNQTRRKAGAA